MKEKINSLILDLKNKQRRAWVMVISFGLLLMGSAALVYAATNPSTSADDLSQGAGLPEESIVGVVGSESSSTGMISGSSWPAELISSDLSQVQPSREGVVVDWNVRVGQYVAAGETLGHLSAPPNTPDLVNMLADRKESLTRMNAEAELADTYTATEQARFKSLADTIDSTTSTSTSIYTALSQLRQEAQIKNSALRAFVEAAFAGQIAMVTNYTDWRTVRYGGFNSNFGRLDQSTQNAFQDAMISLATQLNKSSDVPVEAAQKYFALAVRLGTASGNNSDTDTFKVQATADQKEFLDKLADYRSALAAVSDKETEYKLDIAEKSSALEKDRGSAHAAAQAAQASYDTVLAQVAGGTAIRAPRSGTISAIYKKTGDLVSPEMVLAVVAGSNAHGLVVRMHIPSNVHSPTVGDVLSVVRPGFPNDVRKAKLVGVGTSLDESGTYMADAAISDAHDWPAGSSVRVLQPKETDMPMIPSSALWWSTSGEPMVWQVSSVGRIYAHKISIGRTLGPSIEVYGGLVNGDRYVLKATPDIHDDMMVDDLTGGPQSPASNESGATKQKGMGDMPGMEM